MDMNKPQFLSRAVLGKVLLIMAGDVVATMLSFFLGLWFRYDFSFQEIRAEHLQGFLSAIGPWCVITIVVFLCFRLYSSIWAFVSTSEVFRIAGAYLVLAVIGCTSLPKRLWEKREAALSPALSDGLRTVWVVLVLLVSMAFLVGDSYNPFLYFRF